MRIAIMQPYFMPYIGYFQLINAVDEFIVYDNIQFTKKGWVNRNRILVNGFDSYISLPLKKDSDYLLVKNRFLADTWDSERKKMLNRIVESYRKAPFFNETYDVLERCIMYEDRNLFNFIFHSIQRVVDYLVIESKLTVSSSIVIDHQLKGEDRVIAICKEKKAGVYINPIGGLSLYNKERFCADNLELQFQKSNTIHYKQFNNEFVPWLSIIDLMMFNSKVEITCFLNNYSKV
jgi:hypothetical protein